MTLIQLATYRLTSCMSLIVARGSVLDFVPKNADRAALVNAANVGCLGGGGVDGAVTKAGGPQLAKDRWNLPVVVGTTDNDDDMDGPVRCLTGSAVLTGPNQYGTLPTRYVIHAVGPNYGDYYGEQQPGGMETAHKLLRSAYQTSLGLACQHRLHEVSFALLSAGVYRGPLSLHDVLSQAVQAIENWSQTNRDCALAVTLCAFSPIECETLQAICQDRLEKML